MSAQSLQCSCCSSGTSRALREGGEQAGGRWSAAAGHRSPNWAPHARLPRLSDVTTSDEVDANLSEAPSGGCRSELLHIPDGPGVVRW